MQEHSLIRELDRLVDARLHSPEAVLGLHRSDGRDVVRAFLPGAEEAWLEPDDLPMRHLHRGVFEWRGEPGRISQPYHLRWRDSEGRLHEQSDPYQFSPQLSDSELDAFHEGRHRRLHHMLGSHVLERDDTRGTRFSVWAPNAERVSVVGDFNNWDGRRHPMTSRGQSGVWELFIPGVDDGALYKYEIRNRNSGELLLKADPYARRYELRPDTASVVTPASDFDWSDAGWLDKREDWQHQPISIYELHAASWRRPGGQVLSYRELADALIPWLVQEGFTHLELLPVMEHPLDESWGYQCTGFFAATRRFGEPDELKHFVDRMHGAGIGVILDWVPGHFPKDEHALARFDGSALYEHSDPGRAHTPDWGTLAFNFSRNEVRSFLISSAIYWLEEFHIDALRVDAVASMLYLDYGRKAGEWTPNPHGGNEDLDAVHFLQQLNIATHGECPGTVTIAEESTSWPGVTRPVHLGGLGFSMKWNMGWMHDTLEYFRHDPIHRRHHHDQLTFASVYGWSENYVLALSHDEVVHGKGSLHAKMPGDDWQKFANLRLLFTCQFAWPGKKLLFMGNEFGVRREWASQTELDWSLLKHPMHQGLADLVRDLNRLYREHPALHRLDFLAEGFEWLDCHDADNSVLAWCRTDGARRIAAVLNFTPVPRHGYRIGVPRKGFHREVFNSDSAHYGGTNVGNNGGLPTDDIPWGMHAQSLALTLPPLAGIFLESES